MAERTGSAEGNVDHLVMDRFFPGDRPGVMVEVGTAHPEFLSISALFRSRGWHVIATEPNPAYAAEYEARGISVLPYACSDRDKDDVGFTVVDSHGAPYGGGNVTFESFSSLAIKPGYAKLKRNLDKKIIRVNQRRLDTILAEHFPEVNEIDLVCVDVEGWELEVLTGLSFGKYRPKVLIIENLLFESVYHVFMRERGYRLWKVLVPNDVWVRSDLLSSRETRTALLNELVNPFRRISNTPRLWRRLFFQ
ncbi:MAG TPA: FkbM family methyltransferase [Caulobacteraceae bacterium]|jgi:FkbM family methyltransferase